VDPTDAETAAPGAVGGATAPGGGPGGRALAPVPLRARRSSAEPRALLSRLTPFAGYLAVQALAVAGLVTPRYPDSATYLQLSFTGNSKMLPTIPLLYNVFGSDAQRVAFQVVLAAFAWWTVARIAATAVEDRRVALALRLVLLALGVVGPIVLWNSVILSESIALSLTVLLVAYWFRYSLAPSWRLALPALVVTTAWIFARQAHVILGLLVTAVALGVALRRRRLLAFGIAGALCLGCVLGLAIVGRDPTQNVSVGNVSDTIQDRILPNPGWTSWFVAHGMPYDATVAAAAGGPYGTALQNDPIFFSWLTTSGTSTYLRFAFTHPGYLLWDPLPAFTGELSSLHYAPTTPYPTTQPEPTVSMLSPNANWGRHRQVLPTVVEELVFQQGQAGDVLTLAGLTAAAVALARRRHGADRRRWLPGTVALSAIPQGYFVWLGGGEGELDRLSMVLAVSVRVGLWMTLAFAVDGLLTGRAGRPTAAPAVTGEGGGGAPAGDVAPGGVH